MKRRSANDSTQGLLLLRAVVALGGRGRVDDRISFGRRRRCRFVQRCTARVRRANRSAAAADTAARRRRACESNVRTATRVARNARNEPPRACERELEQQRSSISTTCAPRRHCNAREAESRRHVQYFPLFAPPFWGWGPRPVPATGSEQPPMDRPPTTSAPPNPRRSKCSFRIDHQEFPLRIGLISDTHIPEACARVWPQVLEAFKGVDYIFHAGDVHEFSVLDELQRVAPVYAARGNGEDGSGGAKRRRRRSSGLGFTLASTTATSASTPATRS